MAASPGSTSGSEELLRGDHGRAAGRGLEHRETGSPLGARAARDEAAWVEEIPQRLPLGIPLEADHVAEAERLDPLVHRPARTWAALRLG